MYETLFHLLYTVKPVYNEFPLIKNRMVRIEHRSHGLLYKMISYNQLACNETHF